MLIACQKFWSCMLGHYNWSCHIITRDMRETWGLIYLRTMRTVAMCYLMCSDIMCPLGSMCTQASRLPYVYMVCQELFMNMLFAQATRYLPKITASHFSTLNTKISNQDVLKMILIAMHNENVQRNP